MFLFVSLVMAGCLSGALLLLGLSLSNKNYLDREKTSPFECGFTPKFSARLPFSVRFFLIAIIFLVFDVELILLFPIIPALVGSYFAPAGLSLSLAIIILVLGLFHEIFEGSLAWAN